MKLFFFKLRKKCKIFLLIWMFGVYFVSLNIKKKVFLLSFNADKPVFVFVAALSTPSTRQNQVKHCNL